MVFIRAATELESLDSERLFAELLEESHRRPVWILKHSTACGTSYRALDEFQRFAERAGNRDEAAPAPDGDALPPRFVVLDLRAHRQLSNAVAERSGVRHQSPQALLFSAGEAVWSASHGAVTVARMAAAKPGESIPPPALFR